MDEHQVRDNALFEELDRKKKQRKRKLIRTVLIFIVALAVILTSGVIFLRRQVRKNFAARSGEVTSYTATVGSISTSVSGSGTLTNVDLEEIYLPAGVKVLEVLAEANSKINEGDVIATLDMGSVMTAMAKVQDEIEALDDELVSANNETVSSYITSGVQGRVKKIYAENGSDVADCMYENGALAILSLDGYMAVDFENDYLEANDGLIIVRADGTEIEGYVKCNINGTVTALFSDYDVAYEESLSIKAGDGTELGSGNAYIHSPLKITGNSGTVSGVYAYLDQMVYSGGTVFYLSDTQYSAGYETALRKRNEAEETLQQLINLYQSGALRAEFSGTVTSLDYDESTVTEDTETLVVTMSPDKSMSVTINVDESRIMSLELGQSAQISIDSVGDDIFTGKLTEINKTATSSSGGTRYTAVVTLDKTEAMLAGMTASVVIRISGVDNAVIIPVEALHQTSSMSYVYTQYDENTDKFGGMVEVITGISNSSYVEIISGLNEGDTVWYTEEENMFAGFGSMPGGMGMPGGMDMGSMPQMGQMPSGMNFGSGGRPDFSGGMPRGGFSGGMPSGSRPGGFGA